MKSNLETYSNEELVSELKKRGYQEKSVGPYQRSALVASRYSKRPDENGARLKQYEGTILISPDAKVI